MRLPDFLGIGAVKAGTTWLHDNLRAHPGLFLPLQKPVLYWDRHQDKPIERYARIFQSAGDRLAGEFTASYSVLPAPTIDRIRELMPSLKLILVLREPKSRAWSEARMELSVVNPKPNPTEEDYLAFLASEQCRARGDYASIIRAWRRAFGAAQMHLAVYDDLARSPAEFLTRVFRFLGVSESVDWTQFRLHEKIFKGVERAISPRCAELLDRIYTKDVVCEMSEVAGIDLATLWGYE